MRAVVFDNPLIHRGLPDMGGWIKLGEHSEKDWLFVRNEFIHRYQGYRGRWKCPPYPTRLMGISEMHNAQSGLPIAPPVLLGHAEAAKRVMAGGASEPLLTCTRLRPENLPLPWPEEKVA